MSEELCWIDRARTLVGYHQEALEFIARAAEQLPAASPADALAVGRLWLEADMLDHLVCGLLEEMNTGLIEGRGELDATRGVAPHPHSLDDQGLVYECSWSLLWGDGQGVSVRLAIDPLSEKFQASAAALKTPVTLDLSFPLTQPDLTDALTRAYVAEATWTPFAE